MNNMRHRCCCKLKYCKLHQLLVTASSVVSLLACTCTCCHTLLFCMRIIVMQAHPQPRAMRQTSAQPRTLQRLGVNAECQAWL